MEKLFVCNKQKRVATQAVMRANKQGQDQITGTKGGAYNPIKLSYWPAN